MAKEYQYSFLTKMLMYWFRKTGDARDMEVMLKRWKHHSSNGTTQILESLKHLSNAQVFEVLKQ